MSLLMKALEKAAKDRDETAPARAAAGGAQAPSIAPSGNSELSLEPIAQQQAAAQPVARPATPTPGNPAGAAPGKPAAAASAQAADLIRASHRETGGGIGAYARDNPLVMFGILVALFLIVYGAYVYLQLNPGLFATQPLRPAKATTSTPVAQAVAPAVAPAIAQPSIPLTSLLPPLQAGAEKVKTAPLPPVPLASAASAAAPAPASPAPKAPPQRDTIKITAGGATPALNPVLAEAYQALDTGNLDASQRLYSQLLLTEPNSIDALLGLAAIATQQGDSTLASRHYLKVLELEPRNTLAQAGLIGMLGRADPLAAETRLKQLIARDPSAYLYFTLGNLHADQNRWPDAQQAYFQAHNLQPDNPDYAYNLAVGLEHIGQPRLALDFYRRAIQRASASGRANFSTSAVQERIGKLEKVAK